MVKGDKANKLSCKQKCEDTKGLIPYTVEAGVLLFLKLKCTNVHFRCI